MKDKYQNPDDDMQAVGRLLYTLRAKQLRRIAEELPMSTSGNKLALVNGIMREVKKYSRGIEILDTSPPRLKFSFIVEFE